MRYITHSHVQMFDLADKIACDHLKRRWFESAASLLTRRIRLRGDIYRALVAELDKEQP